MHTMHKYTTDEGALRWSVGFWEPPAYDTDTDTWMHLLDFINLKDAAAWVSFLNGGERPKGVEK